MNTKGTVDLYTGHFFLYKPGAHNFCVDTFAQFQSFELTVLKNENFQTSAF